MDSSKRRRLDFKGYGVSNEKKVREEDDSGVPRKYKKSEGEEKCVKVVLCNEDNSDSYKGLVNVYEAGESSEVIITVNINYDTSLDECKGPPTLEMGKF